MQREIAELLDYFRDYGVLPLILALPAIAVYVAYKLQNRDETDGGMR